ncbi:UDP-2,4-diacetamido-2,4,6-trideoxy-beta-L-altropyranose hydrolase [Colwellia hornerae]|uniref:UDP-2,4-diacetamido-2,4, 6-trideoxy-beta-L-altropyranose hydrolase n=1 Tax=Colwellia hornerae TaxID=89402 RepID=A0A5C6QJR6_9GAMM|nr:UDP-2,4-diacetamido-2,4,6-trideoxy-beta-L-altropyranose hydrolase [Colwellia hornerae]TWX54034.1 UDP-2,4-diacetamido-2,4,6-trideoxy-beta-L-altropyranose hydrolase [Colwellia hornerae]TWX60809.1 UDP-2,4-diacetamido-2,4,6-trideoxy-beta-L-altropyranose hydrolase [Colwellia hornerae]TWX69139.1 UDP-2,4-diacetamido-2,4,6-trideoxy-beta-L-altropyranose hydrolase [Colwellia hornerae]
MKIVFRADASIHIGSGHIMRCLVLANLLLAKGYDVLFATRPQKGDFVAYLKNEGIEVVELAQANTLKTPKYDTDYAAWLQVEWQDDAKDFVQQVTTADLIVVDHYGLNKAWEINVSNALNAKVLAIDDLVREHFADLLLDQTFGRDSFDYISNNNHCPILAGSDFALLAPKFAMLRANQRYCKKPQASYKILVSMGAIDKPNITLKVLEKLQCINNIDFKVTVLLSERSPSYKRVNAFCCDHKNFEHINFSSNMAQLMSEHHIAIGAPGSTSWERACLGLPSIIIPIAENQVDIARNVANSGAAILLEINTIDSGFEAALSEIVFKWNEYHEASLKLTDGLGGNRVVNKIEQLFN